MPADPANAIPPNPSETARRELLARVLGARARDLAAVESAHRELIAADPALHRRFLAYLAAREPESAHLGVGLALLAAGTPEDRALVRALAAKLPVGTLARVVDYVNGWVVRRVHVKPTRKRYADEMSAAYEAGADLVKASLKREGTTADDAGDFLGGELVVTLGEYDKVQQVLDHLGLPYTVTPAKVIERAALRADQVLLVNCPGNFSPAGVEAIRRFVAAGGTLITTDWALLNTVQAAFPGTIEYNQLATGDDVVGVSHVDPDHAFTRGVEVPGQTIRWWLEGSSYPIHVTDSRVVVLMRSEEMGRKYRDDPVVVTFAYGEGVVVHLTSHYYLQRSQGDKSAMAADVARALGAASEWSADKLKSLNATQLAAAYSSMRLLANILYERRRATGV